MPVYCFIAPDGERRTERTMPMAKATDHIMVDGERWDRDYEAEQKGAPARSGWPMEPCFASGVNANQADDLRKEFKKHGLGHIQVTNDGDPIYPDKKTREKALKVRGLFDRAGYY